MAGLTSAFTHGSACLLAACILIISGVPSGKALASKVVDMSVHSGYTGKTEQGEIQPAELSFCVALQSALLLNGCCRSLMRAAGDTGLSSEKMLSGSWHAKDQVVRAIVHACKESLMTSDLMMALLMAILL